MYVYVGTSTAGDSRGIYFLEVHHLTGALSVPVLAAEAENPSYLLSTDNGYLYAVAENEQDGRVAAYEIDKFNAQLTYLNRKPAGGSFPCHLCVDKNEQYLFLANYGDGKLTSLAIECDGTLGETVDLIEHHGSGPVQGRQDGPHVHFSAFTPDGTALCVIDLGCDTLTVYPFNRQSGKLDQNNKQIISFQPGMGPRHMVFSPCGEYAYVVCELSNQVIVFSVSDGHRFEQIQSISTLPQDFHEKSTCAAIRITSDGSFVYVSNRGHDSLAAFRVKENGTLALNQIIGCGGKNPRDFAITPDGRFLVVANKATGTVDTFRIDPEVGLLQPTGSKQRVAGASCICFVAS